MSDADAEADSDTPTGREDVWVEKYRPERLDEVVGHEAIIERIQAYVSDNDLANLLFAGPAGTGKCVGADTPVLTTHGVEPIGTVVGDADGLESPSDDRRIVTLSADGFEYVAPEHVYAKQADRTLTVDTRDGVSMHVTPEHKLLTVTNEGFAWRPADTLGAGDRIVRPKSLPMPAGDASLPWPQAMDERETLVTAPDGVSERPLADTDPTNLHDDTVRIRTRLGDDLAPEIAPPVRLTPDLGAFLGLLLGGGAVHEEAITFSGPATLRDRFVTLATEQFDVTPTVENTTVRIENRTLVAFLTACFDIVAPADAYGARLVTAPAPVRTAFLRAAIDAGGTVTDAPAIEIPGSEATVTLLAYLLAGVGIPTQRRTRDDTVVLTITESTAIARFVASIGFIRETQTTALQTILVDASRDPDGAPATTTPTPMPDGGATVASRPSSPDRADLHVDRIADISEDDTPRRVYDLAVPGTHNYVAGTLPTVMHNTTTALAIAKEIYGEDWQENFLELNASDERGIDVVRGRIKEFARASFGEYDFRIIFLDEADALCVPPGTEVVTGYPSSPEVKQIEDVAKDGEPIPSVDFETNEIQSDNGRLVDSGVADFFKVELEDGREIEASLTHPFFVVGEDGTLVEKELRELSAGDEIADFKDDIGVSRCETCGDWTAGRFCSVPCKNGGHSNSLTGEGNPMDGTEWSDERRENVVSDGGVRIVQTVEVRSIEYSHRGQAYNISMAGTPNFMLANGILTHNTSDAQSALRRTMEQFSGQTRFILSCNYSSRIIDPIQSRCAVFRFSPLADEAVIEQARQVADAEGLTVTDDGFEAIAYVADGDMRRAINALQAAATAEGPIDEAAVYAITSTARPEEVLEMAQHAIDGDFMTARAKLESLLVDRGIAGGDILDQLHRSVWDLDIDEAAAVRLMDRIGETEYRIVEGADERIQLEAMLASLALD